MNGEAKATFGDWLRQRRLELGVTQEELSNNLGFSLALLRKLESAERHPSGQIAQLLADFFKIPADERQAFVAFARTGRAAVSQGGATLPGSGSGEGHSAQTLLAPWRRAYVRQTNLPASLTPILGRERERVAALDLLLQPKTRLLTLTGPAGIGKTRLAIEIVSGLIEHFEDGVFFVDLAPLNDPELVLPTIARTLGLQEVENHSFELVLSDYLRERRIALLLDNFEQVLDAAIEIVRLLEKCPWVKICVTSREVLHVRGERRVNVTPLEVPDRSELEPLSLGKIAVYPAVELFTERARAVTPDFELTLENASAVVALCAGLDGVPLAIELAAARVRHFSPTELHSGLSSRLKLLTGGARDLPARHRTLRSAIEWSYDLLNPVEQRLFRFAGVFAGGLSAEALTSPPGDQPEVTFDTLMALADKNLVRAERRTFGLSEWRFSFLEAVREYAVEQLDKHGETGEGRHAHANYYLRLAEQAEKHFTGPQNPAWGSEQIAWMDRLEADLDNIRAALDWFQLQLESGSEPSAGETSARAGLEDLQNGLTLATALRRIWLARGHPTEGIQRLTGFVAKVPKPLPTDLPGLKLTYAKALAIIGRLSPLRGNEAAVQALMAESLAIATEFGDKPLIALVKLVAGALAQSQGNNKEANRFQLECLQLYRELGNKWGAAAVLQELGDTELNQGNIETARPLLEESLQLFREVGETFGASSVLVSLGSLAYSQTNYTQAHNLWQESLDLRQEIDYSSELGYSLVILGWVNLREGNYTQAYKYFSEGLLRPGTEKVFTVYWGLVGLAALCQAKGQPQQSALLLGSAEGLAETGNIRLSHLKRVELEQETVKTRAQLTSADWDDEWARGFEITNNIKNLLQAEAPALNQIITNFLEVTGFLAKE